MVLVWKHVLDVYTSRNLIRFFDLLFNGYSAKRNAKFSRTHTQVGRNILAKPDV